MSNVPLGELSEGECDALLGRQEDGEQISETRHASHPIGRHLHVPAVASLTLLAAGIVFLGIQHMPKSTQVFMADATVLNENTSLSHNGTTQSNTTRPVTTTSTTGMVSVVSSGERLATCKELALLKVKKVLHNNLGGHGPDNGEEGIIYEMGLFMTDHLGNEINDVVGNVAIHATSPYFTKGDSSYNGLHGKFMSIGIHPGTNVSFTIHAYDPKTNATVTLPYFSITFFDIDEGLEHKCSEYIIAKDVEHYYTSADTQVNVTHGENGTITLHATKSGTGEDNPRDSEALTPEMKSKGVTLQYLNTAQAEFTIGAEDGTTFRGFNFVLRPSLLCAKTMIQGQLEDPWNTSIEGMELPMMDGRESVTGMAVPKFEVFFPEVNDSNGSINVSNVNFSDIAFKKAEDSGSSTGHFGSLCAVMIAAAVQWTSPA